MKDTSVGGAVPEWMHPALAELEAAVLDDRVAHKNTAILLEAQVAVRKLCGGRVTFCKSGKVRDNRYSIFGGPYVVNRTKYCQ